MFVCTEGDKSFCEWTLNRCDTKTFCDCTFRDTGRDILCVLSAVWSIASAWKPFPVGSERETGGLAACVCVSQLVCLFYFLVCFLRVLRGGVMERGVLSVLYTKKIKLLMAWVSSNGTLSWVCVFYVCVCINKAAFKASLIHGCITAFRPGLSLSFLFAAPSLCPYMWASCAFCFQAAELRPSAPCVPMKDPLCFCGVPAPHPTSITPNHCCEGEHSLIFLLMWEHFTCRRTCY